MDEKEDSRRHRDDAKIMESFQARVVMMGAGRTVICESPVKSPESRFLKGDYTLAAFPPIDSAIETAEELLVDHQYESLVA